MPRGAKVRQQIPLPRGPIGRTGRLGVQPQHHSLIEGARVVRSGAQSVNAKPRELIVLYYE